jgi:hypothetical protein
MKTFFVSALLLMCTLSASAQKDLGGSNSDGDVDLHLGDGADKSKYLNRERQGKALSFQYIEFGAASDLNNYFDNASSVRGGGFNPYNMAIGLDDISNNSEHMDMISSIGFLLPQKITAGPNDSVMLKLNGWHYTMSVLGFDLIKGETVTLAIGPAWSYGNFKARRSVNGQKTKYTNPFVAPGGRAEFRLTFGDFMIGGRVTYRYDLTHGLWKRKDDFMPVMPEYKNHGMAYFGYIGLIL